MHPGNRPKPSGEEVVVNPRGAVSCDQLGKCESIAQPINFHHFIALATHDATASLPESTLPVQLCPSLFAGFDRPWNLSPRVWSRLQQRPGGIRRRETRASQRYLTRYPR